MLSDVSALNAHTTVWHLFTPRVTPVVTGTDPVPLFTEFEAFGSIYVDNVSGEAVTVAESSALVALLGAADAVGVLRRLRRGQLAGAVPRVNLDPPRPPLRAPRHNLARIPTTIMAHELPALPYAKEALEPHIDALTMEIHHGRHHKAYVDNLNKAIAGNAALEAKSLEALISDLASVPDAIRGPVRNNGGGHWNHSFFWKLMGPNRGGTPSGDLAAAINAAFGSFDDFKAKFEAAGLGRFGSGWAWLVVQNGTLAIVSTPNQDNPLMGKLVSGVEGTAILGVDVWEHAYYLKYQNKRADYLKAFWNVVDWNAVSALFAAAK